MSKSYRVVGIYTNFDGIVGISTSIGNVAITTRSLPGMDFWVSESQELPAGDILSQKTSQECGKFNIERYITDKGVDILTDIHPHTCYIVIQSIISRLPTCCCQVLIVVHSVKMSIIRLCSVNLQY